MVDVLSDSSECPIIALVPAAKSHGDRGTNVALGAKISIFFDNATARYEKFCEIL